MVMSGENQVNVEFVHQRCGNDSQILAYANTVKIPVYTGEQIAKKYASGASLAASKGA